MWDSKRETFVSRWLARVLFLFNSQLEDKDQSHMSPNIHLSFSRSHRIRPTQGQRKMYVQGGKRSEFFAVLFNPNSVTLTDAQLDVEICIALFFSHKLTILSFSRGTQPSLLSLFVKQTEQTKHLGLFIPFVSVQGRREQLDELGPNTLIRRRFHSLPCGILKHSNATRYKQLATSIEMTGIRGENPQVRLTWTESQPTYNHGNEKLKRQPDSQGGLTLTVAFTNHICP